MAKYNITEPVHVDVRLHGETVTLDLTPGETELSDEVAELLVHQGLATLASSAKPKPAKNTTPENSED